MVDARKLKYDQGWHDLWDQNVIPWHKTDVNPKLVKHLDAAIEATGKTDPSEIRILVPLCGKSVDLMYLYEKGFTVVGVEFNDTAARDFFTENKLAVDKSVVGNFTFYKTKDKRLEIICGDFFRILEPAVIDDKFDICWDRGSLVAIDIDSRKKYADVIMNVMRAKCGYLIASIERDPATETDRMMPHSLSYAHVHELYGTGFNIHVLEQFYSKEPDQNGGGWTKDNTFFLTRKTITEESVMSEKRLDMWTGRWVDFNTKWHKSEVNEHLLRHFDVLRNGKDKIKIFFPLCGKSVDLVHLYKEGHTVVGNEAVSSAVDMMFKTGGVEYKKKYHPEVEGFVYRSLDAKLIVFACDFFKMSPDLLDFKFDAVFDRGAFEAIAEADRKGYIQTILKLLSPDFRYVLNCYEYEDDVFKGPPRSIPRQVVTDMFSGYDLGGGMVSKASVVETEDFSSYGRERYNITGSTTKILYRIEAVDAITSK